MGFGVNVRVELRACARCGGDISNEGDQKRCLQCGHTVEVDVRLGERPAMHRERALYHGSIPELRATGLVLNRKDDGTISAAFCPFCQTRMIVRGYTSRYMRGTRLSGAFYVCPEHGDEFRVFLALGMRRMYWESVDRVDDGVLKTLVAKGLTAKVTG